MKIERIICVVATLCCVTTPAMSQVDKEVEVTQAFIPQVMPATKPTILPDMTDDAYINPDIDYSITPISIHNEIDTTPYKAVEMDYWEYKRSNNIYAKLGGGYPTSFLADLYATKSNSKGYKIGYLNYDGNYADITNDYGVKSDASQTHIKTGVAMGVYVGQREFLGAFDYMSDRWSRYATSVDNDEHPLYQRLNLALGYGDNFKDMSRWNYSFGAGVERMWSRSDYDNTTVAAKADLGREIGKGEFMLSGQYSYVGGSDDYRNNMVGATLLYKYERKRAKVSVGGDFCYENITYSDNALSVATALDDTHKYHFLPRFNFDFMISEARAIGYVEVEGEVVRNDFASLSLRNPYIAAGMFGAASTVVYDMGVGLKGTIADKRVGYNLSWRYNRTNSYMYWIFRETFQPSSSNIDNDFIAHLSDSDNLNFVFEGEYRPNAKWRFGLSGVVSGDINVRDHGLEDGVPTMQLYVDGEYKLERFKLRVGCEVLSSRTFTLFCSGEQSTRTIAPTADLEASAEYKFKRGDWVMFCDVTNIINDKLYKWVGYREYGVGAIVGVKFEF